MGHEGELAVFLVSLALLLGTARILGEVARRLRFPSVSGELAAGVILGPTILGRLAPGSTRTLFPPGAPSTMLNGYTLLSSVLLLTLAGLEIDLPMVWRRRREAALTSLAGVALPLALGVALGFALPARYMVSSNARLLFALFLGTALSISAMPVIAKTLLDLGFLRTNLGILVMASATVDDLFGWLMFSVLVGPMHGHAAGWGALVLRVFAVLAFAALVIGPGRHVFDRLLALLERDRVSAPGRVLSALIVLAILGAATTQAIGVHAVFGAFLVGVAVGHSKHLRAETRSVVHEFVSNVFAPVFFAAVGLRVDFVKSFDLLLTIAVVVVACVAKVAGCTLGARAGGNAWRTAWGVGFAMNSRGAMEIILALIALEAGLIRPEMFVALVIMALVTSVISGPLVDRLLRSGKKIDVQTLLEEGVVTLSMRAKTAEQAVRELAQALAGGTGFDGNALAEAVFEDEGGARGGLADGIALTYARVDGIARPMLALGRSDDGLDFNARDGKPARIVFLLLVPRKDAARVMDLHMSIVYSVATAAQRTEILEAATRDDIVQAVERSKSMPPRGDAISVPAPIQA